MKTEANPNMCNKLKKQLLGYQKPIAKTYQQIKVFTLTQLRQRPWVVLGTLALVVITLILVGSYLQQEKPEAQNDQETILSVDTFQIGTNPRINVLAKIQKENVVTIVAQKPGVVQKIYVQEGDHIPYKGQNLVYLSDNYQGGNASSLQRQIAQKQYENTKGTLPTQLDTIAKQKELANLQETNDDELRKLQQDTLDDARSQLDRNEDLLTLVEQAQEDLPASVSAGLDQYDQLTVQLKQGNDQLRQQIRQLEYQTDDDNPPGELADTQRALALQQLELQEKSIKLSAEIGELQYKLAQVQEGLSFPSSVSNGDIELVHVSVGQYVQPGTPLVTMKGCNDLITATITTSKSIAQSVNLTSPAVFHLGEESVELYPRFISSEPVANGSYVIKFAVPAEHDNLIGNNQLIKVDLPVGMADTSATVPFVPLESVYQSSDGSFLYTLEDQKAQVTKVELGEVYGRFVQVQSGLSNSQQVILNRNVIDGQTVEAKQI